MKHNGVIYILTNPAFPQYVKIEDGYVVSNKEQKPLCFKM